MEEFLRKLGISDKPEPSKDNSFVINLEDADTYGRYYSKLDKSNEIEQDTENSKETEDISNIEYFNDDYTITLTANFETDDYKLIIREN